MKRARYLLPPHAHPDSRRAGGLAPPDRRPGPAVLAEAGSVGRLEAVGIAAPGPVSPAREADARAAEHEGLGRRAAGPMGAEAFGRPVFMNNDANACALAEYLYGSCRGTPNLVYLTLSTGLGAGFILDGG